MTHVGQCILDLLILSENLSRKGEVKTPVLRPDAASIDDAKAVVALIEQKFPALKGKIIINWVGPVIGAHTGPGVVSIFFVGTER